MNNSNSGDKPKIGIIGGGVIGTSLLFQLAKRGFTDVTLFEKGQLGSGSTSKAAGGIRNVFANRFNIKLANKYIKFFKNFESEIGYDVEFSQSGYMYLLHDDEERAEWNDRMDLYDEYGVSIEILSSSEAVDICPWLNQNEFSWAVFASDCGHVDPSQVNQAHARAAMDHGADIETKTRVTDIVVEDGAVSGVTTDSGKWPVDILINAAGPWAPTVAEMVGVNLPIELIARKIAVTSSIGGGGDSPLVVDNNRNCYFRTEQNGSLLVCDMDADIHDIKEPEAISKNDIGYNYYLNMTDKLHDLIEGVAEVEIINGWVGIQSHTADKSPIVGATSVDGFWVATGFSGHGIQKSPIIGSALADTIVNGSTDIVDLDHFSLDRFDGSHELHGEPLNM